MRGKWGYGASWGPRRPGWTGTITTTSSTCLGALPPGRPLAPFLPLLFCPSLRHPAPSSSQFCTHDILLFGHAPPTRVSASPLPRLPPGSHAATAAPGCALLELARAARPGRGSMSCLRSVPVCVVAIVVVYVKERDTRALRDFHAGRRNQIWRRCLRMISMGTPTSTGASGLGCPSYTLLLKSLATSNGPISHTAGRS